MNKKLIIIILTILIVILIGIGIYFLINNKDDEIKEDNNVNSLENVAIVYFSATGNTEKVAEKIEKITNAPSFEIVPTLEYTTADLDYNNDESRANIEQNDDNARPQIASNIDIEDYDVIYLGYPIWWGTLPKIILTFLDEHDMSGKTIIPFCTSGGSGITTSVNVL